MDSPTVRTPPDVVAVVVDLVESRKIADRRSVQSGILESFAEVNGLVAVVQPLEATVGDEFQAVYPGLSEALSATLLARLSLPSGVDCRFGLGFGGLWSVGEGTTGVVQDGPAWWRAREAIDEAHRREDSRNPTLRSWYRSSDDIQSSAVPSMESVVNAYLLARDHLITLMNSRSRRLVYGMLVGRSQGELASAEGITQSAVSQSIRRSGGAALLSGMQVFAGAIS